MDYFYKALNDHLAVDAALARAQSETRAQPGLEHPFFWAGFIVAGEGGAVNFAPGSRRGRCSCCGE